MPACGLKNPMSHVRWREARDGLNEILDQEELVKRRDDNNKRAREQADEKVFNLT